MSGVTSIINSARVARRCRQAVARIHRRTRGVSRRLRVGVAAYAARARAPAALIIARFARRLLGVVQPTVSSSCPNVEATHLRASQLACYVLSALTLAWRCET